MGIFLMKTFNNFFIALLIILTNSTLVSSDFAVELDSKEPLTQSDDKHTHLLNQDEHGNIIGVESVALEQPGADSEESVVFNFEDIDLKNVADYMERVHKVKFITEDILDYYISASIYLHSSPVYH